MTREEFWEIYSNGDPLSGLNLSGIDLSRESLRDMDLTGANLSNANFTNADLSNAILTNANLTGAVFTNANLSNAILTNANLTGAVFVLTKLDGTGFEHLRQEKQLDLKREITHTGYLETAKKRADGIVKYYQMGQLADIHITFEPISAGTPAAGVQVIDANRNVVFVNNVSQKVIEPKYMEAVLEVIKEAKGILIGAPLTNIQITVIDGAMSDTASSKEAFRKATLMALDYATQKASMYILEPVYNLTILATEN